MKKMKMPTKEKAIEKVIELLPIAIILIVIIIGIYFNSLEKKYDESHRENATPTMPK